jgi:hypothetical protein
MALSARRVVPTHLHNSGAGQLDLVQVVRRLWRVAVVARANTPIEAGKQSDGDDREHAGDDEQVHLSIVRGHAGEVKSLRQRNRDTELGRL